MKPELVRRDRAGLNSLHVAVLVRTSRPRSGVCLVSLHARLRQEQVMWWLPW